MRIAHNNNGKIGSNTILELSESNSTPKSNSWEKSYLSTYKDYLGHILKWCETLAYSVLFHPLLTI